MYILTVSMMFTLTSPSFEQKFIFPTYDSCEADRTQKIKALDKMNEQSLMLGYSAKCEQV